GRMAGMLDMTLVGLGRVPERHDAVADILVDGAVVGCDWPGKPVEIARQPSGKDLRLDALTDAREAFDVAEHDGDLAAVPADAGYVRGVQDLTHEVLGNVASEHLQRLAHPLDGLRQQDDLADTAADGLAGRKVEVADASSAIGDASD